MKGKCNCGKKATSEWIIQNKGVAWSMKYCDTCKPKHTTAEIQLIDGK
jgi:hypothetical protein